jgi:predicted phosphate transport protein (TIGR00153 family)
LSEGRSLLDWFGKRRESVIMNQIRNHALKVRDTVMELDRAVAAVGDGEKEKALEAIKRLLVSEKDADNLENSITEELSKGDLETREREDLMHLVRRLDYVADWAKEASLNLQLILEADVEVPRSLWASYRMMTEELEKAAKEIKISIDNFGTDIEAVMKHEREVEACEHVLDDLYFSTKKEILFAQMDPRAIFLMRDMLHGIENSADSCKDAADIIHILVTSDLHRGR